MENESQKIPKRDDIKFEGNVAVYSVNHQGIHNGTYIGQFEFKTILLPLDKLSIGRERRALLGEFADFATDEEKLYAVAMSELKYRIIKAPPFWTTITGNGNIPDYDLLVKVLDASFYAENFYTQLKKEEKEELIKKANEAALKIIEDKAKAAKDEVKA